MGAKTWMLVHASVNARTALAALPRLDREATGALARTLFPGEKLVPLEDGNLSRACPPDAELAIGCFPGVAIVAAKEFGIERPSRLERRFLAAWSGGTTTLHAMHSVVDWFAYAVWSDGRLVRSLSLSPDSGILEDSGARLPFEEPYWAGEHPDGDPDEEPDDSAFPFHPLELGEAALRECFGYHLEGPIDAALLEPESIPLVRYQRSRSRWWKLW